MRDERVLRKYVSDALTDKAKSGSLLHWQQYVGVLNERWRSKLR